jgi:hypothetical protein
LLNDIGRIKQSLVEFHKFYLRNNQYDEGDILYHRINYKLMETFQVTKDDAEKIHLKYHEDNERRISEGYCDNCKSITKIIPIIYGVSNEERETLKVAENEERIIIGSLADIKSGVSLAMFGCKICKKPLPQYGSMY